MYTVEQQKAVHDLVYDIEFFSHRVTIFDAKGGRDTLQEKCNDLMNYIDSIETGNDHEAN